MSLNTFAALGVSAERGEAGGRRGGSGRVEGECRAGPAGRAGRAWGCCAGSI
jgi:hypothetical protein